MKKRVKVIKKISVALSGFIVGLAVSAALVTAVSQTALAQTSKDQFNSSESETFCPEGKYIKDDGTPCTTKRDIPLPPNSNPSIVDKIINPFITLMTAIVGIVIAISLVAAAITYSSAGGDPSRVAAAKKRITNSIVALIAYIFTFGIIEWLVPGGLL